MKIRRVEHLPETFSSLSIVAVIVGIVIGIGIFRLPPLVAQQAASEIQFLSYWFAGGLISLLGALCYAELASFKPDAGGEYYFLYEAYGAIPAFIFSWGRMTVIQTGSIALAAFILGDYASQLLNLGPYSSSIYAAATVITVTGLNLYGTGESRRTQNILALSIVLLLTGLSLAGFSVASTGEWKSAEHIWDFPNAEAAGTAMIFVLLTFGGWNEAAYLSAELKGAKRSMAVILTSGIILITIIYLLVNIAYLHLLGLDGLQQAEAVGANFTEKILGSGGAAAVAVIVILASFSTTNATVITGARTNFALGRDFRVLNFLNGWHITRNTPTRALIVQGTIALLLVFMGTFTEEAVATMVDYTAPVFWLFLFLSTFSLFVFRFRHDPEQIPFKVPFYPITPLLFLLACGYMLYSSLVFTGPGALFGVGILCLGLPLLILEYRKKNST